MIGARAGISRASLLIEPDRQPPGRAEPERNKSKEQQEKRRKKKSKPFSPLPFLSRTNIRTGKQGRIVRTDQTTGYQMLPGWSLCPVRTGKIEALLHGIVNSEWGRGGDWVSSKAK
jgi:hypothetical protein